MKFIFLLLLSSPFLLFAQQEAKIPTIDINKAAYKIIDVHEAPDFLATDGDEAWVIDDTHNRIHKLSIKNDKPLLTVDIPGACAAPVIAFNAVWMMSCPEKTLYRLDKTDGHIIKKILTGVADPNGEMSLATGDGSIWLLSDSSGILIRVDPKSNSIQSKISVKPYSYCVAFGYSSVWITNGKDNSVQRIDTKTDTVTATISVGKKPRFLSAGENGVWTLNQGDGTVSRIDPSSNKTIATIDVKAPGGGGDIVAGLGKVWVVSTNKERWLQSINPANNLVDKIYLQMDENKKKLKVDGAIRASSKYIWVSNLYSQNVWVLK